MTQKRALILLGGMWHDFDGFAHSISNLLETVGWRSQASYDLDDLTRLDGDGFDLVLSYTCFSKHAEGLDNSGPEKMTDAQLDGIIRWVQAGGAFLSAHCASVCGRTGPGLRELTGGYFVEHPDPFVFTVYPAYHPHPITAGIDAFAVYDEMYMEQCDPSVEVHMLTIDRGVAYPLVWSKSAGRGRVAHVALGHFAAVWEHPSYRRLMLQTVNWLTQQQETPAEESPKS